MTPFRYARARDAEEASLALAAPGEALLGGGTSLIDLMRRGLASPAGLTDVTGLSSLVTETAEGGLRIGGAMRNSALAAHPLIRARYPLLARAVLSGASGQIRNMATLAGNLMQHSRCLYFSDREGSNCNKRAPGSGCDAQEGFNRYAAILGGSKACVSVHPSDMCVALAALDAQICVTGPGGSRRIAIEDFYLLPGATPWVETALSAAEVITGIELPPLAMARQSHYRKIRDRASFAFALVSVAACLELEGGVIRDLRLAFGGVAPKPWRARQAEALLRGQRPEAALLRAGLETEFAEARPLAGNGFKAEMAIRAGVSVLEELVQSAAGDRG